MCRDLVVVAASFNSNCEIHANADTPETEADLQLPCNSPIEADPNSWAPMGDPDVKCALDTELGGERRWNSPQFLEWHASFAHERKCHLILDDSPTD
jgi:hypothetical protein